MATCAGIVGLELADDASEDSVSFLPALNETAIPNEDERLVIHHSDNSIFSIRRAKWKGMFDDLAGPKRTDPRKDDPSINATSLQLFDHHRYPRYRAGDGTNL